MRDFFVQIFTIIMGFTSALYFLMQITTGKPTSTQTDALVETSTLDDMVNLKQGVNTGDSQ